MLRTTIRFLDRSFSVTYFLDYSPCIFKRPNPTLRPVKTKAHIMPAIVKISFAIITVINKFTYFLIEFNFYPKRLKTISSPNN